MILLSQPNNIEAGTSLGLLPMNVPTRNAVNINIPYQQVGILTLPSSSYSNGSIFNCRKNTTPEETPTTNTLILPLMGKIEDNRRNKWLYYTMANGVGNINTKLPITVKGKSSMSQIGCDEIYNGDVVYVSGYKGEFIATIYESNLFRYMPTIL